MTETYKVSQVFTPATPARITFVERKSLNEQLVNAIATPGKQLVVYGHSGSGKTTLLRNKLQQLTEEEEVISRCTKDTSYESLIRDAFDQLGSFYINESSDKQVSGRTLGLSAEYLKIKASWNTQTEQSNANAAKRVIPVQLTPQRLVDFFGTAKRIWVVEDFHKIPYEQKVRFAQIMKVFMDGADQYPEIKIIAIGAAGTAREVVECDIEMRNRVSEIYVPLMTDGELLSIINIGEQALKCQFQSEVANNVVRFSSGLAAVCHQICLNICYAASIHTTQDKLFYFNQSHIQSAIKRYLEDSSDTLKSIYDRATKYKNKGKYANCELVVHGLATLDTGGASHSNLLEEIRRVVPEYPSANLTRYLKELQTPMRGEILRYDTNAKTYCFSSPLYRAYALVTSERASNKRRMARIKHDQIYRVEGDISLNIGPTNINLSDNTAIPREYITEQYTIRIKYLLEDTFEHYSDNAVLSDMFKQLSDEVDVVFSTQVVRHDPTFVLILERFLKEITQKSPQKERLVELINDLIGMYPNDKSLVDFALTMQMIGDEII